MKKFQELTNTDRAEFLHDLFPQEIPALLDYLTALCETISEAQELNKNHWLSQAISFDFLIKQVSETQIKINRYSQKMASSKKLFADQLFDGNVALFVIHSLKEYVIRREHPNAKFTHTVLLLFTP